MLPSKVQLHKRSKRLELHFGEQVFNLSTEFLRVHSPSAEVKGHGPGQEVLQHGKKDVAITQVDAVGNYALKLVFDDGHDSGIFSWDYLYQLCTEQDTLWQRYLEKLRDDNLTRDKDLQSLRFIDP